MMDWDKLKEITSYIEPHTRKGALSEKADDLARLALAGKALAEAATEYRRTSGLMKVFNRSEGIRQQHSEALTMLDQALIAWEKAEKGEP